MKRHGKIVRCIAIAAARDLGRSRRRQERVSRQFFHAANEALADAFKAAGTRLRKKFQLEMLFF
jgi:hypothetical protein